MSERRGAAGVHMLTLGCPKNRVDSEVMLAVLADAGYHHVPRPEDAEVIVVNTCGFIDPAREESVEAIVALAEHKRGRCRQLVVAGCLSQRHGSELAAALPEVDHFLGTGNFTAIARVLAGEPPPVAPARDHPRLRGPHRLVPYAHAASGGRPAIPDPDFPLAEGAARVASQAPHSRYLKVSEGCSNTCSFCVIPRLRGPQRSRPIAGVVADAQALIRAGARELNLIAQDLCAYGRDLRPRQTLAELLWALDAAVAASGHRVWLRCLYAYPRGLTDEVIDALAEARHVVPYLDMPLQHISDRILGAMRRGASEDHTRRLVARLAARVPNLALRTTFIAGLPGEGEREFAELCDFVRQARFAHLGVFPFSPQPDTPAAAMADQVPRAAAVARRDHLMRLQKEISREALAAMVGQEVEVLVDGVAEESDLLLQGRHAGQAPEVDGLTYLTAGQAAAGDWVRVAIDQAGDYDLAGPMVGEAEGQPEGVGGSRCEPVC